MKKYDEKIKRAIIGRFSKGETVLQISKATGISRPTIYSWVKEGENKSEHKVNMSDYKKLQAHCEKLERMITILKTCGCSVYDRSIKNMKQFQNYQENIVFLRFVMHLMFLKEVIIIIF